MVPRLGSGTSAAVGSGASSPDACRPGWTLQRQRPLGPTELHVAWLAAGRPELRLEKPGPAPEPRVPPLPDRAAVLQAFGVEDEQSFLHWARQERRARRKAQKPLGEEGEGEDADDDDLFGDSPWAG